MSDTEEGMKLELAHFALRCVERQLLEIQRDYYELVGKGELGLSGPQVFTSVHQIAEAIERYKQQIDRYKVLIEDFYSTTDTRERAASAKIRAIVNELGIKL